MTAAVRLQAVAGVRHLLGVVDAQRAHALEHEHRVGELLLVVDAVALERVVGVDQAHDRLEIALFAGVVPVLDHGHTAEVMRLTADLTRGFGPDALENGG